MELVSLSPLDYCFPEEFTKVMLNIPSALLMRRPITSHGAFGAYAYPSSIYVLADPGSKG